MKTLFLVRHAKSSKDDPKRPDSERPLNDRGMRAATKMGERLAKREVKLDLIASSPALRALTTAQLIAKELDYEARDIVADGRLYATSPDALLEVIHQLKDKHKRVMLFGHNPEFSDLAHRLSGKITHMATCAVAEFSFDTKSWSDIGRQAPHKVALYEPKEA